MAVTAKAQGYKIGTTLLEHCLNNAKQKQIKKTYSVLKHLFRINNTFVPKILICGNRIGRWAL